MQIKFNFVSERSKIYVKWICKGGGYFLIRNRLLLKNKVEYKEGMIMIRENLYNRMKEYDKIKTNDINIRNIIIEQREIVNKYIVIINKLLLKK